MPAKNCQKFNDFASAREIDQISSPFYTNTISLCDTAKSLSISTEFPSSHWFREPGNQQNPTRSVRSSGAIEARNGHGGEMPQHVEKEL